MDDACPHAKQSGWALPDTVHQTNCKWTRASSIREKTTEHLEQSTRGRLCELRWCSGVLAMTPKARKERNADGASSEPETLLQTVPTRAEKALRPEEDV